MTSEIKERIAAINSGISPEGYKKTKVGIVPVEWEVDHIGKHLQEYREISNDIEKYPVYSSSRKGLIPQSDYYDQKEATQTNLGYKIVPVGYVTYRHMSDDDVFHFNFNTTGQSVLVSSEYPVFNAKSNANLYYIISCLNEMPRFRYFCRSQKLGGTRTRLYYKNLSMYQLSFPPLPEQQKIAEILSTQDKLIELQEKKIEQLKELKKAYLQKMFPKKGSKYPELRFKGFTEPWKQHKLGEIATFINGRAYSQDELLSSGKYKVLRVGNFYTNDSWYYSDMELEDKYYAENGDLLYTWSATFGPHIWRGDKVIYHYHIWKIELSQHLEKRFAVQLLEQDKAAILSDKNGSTMVHITKAGMEEKAVLIPQNIDEQVKIGTFLNNLDTLITLHQRKSEQEKQKKKALMQLLLTGIVRTK